MDTSSLVIPAERIEQRIVFLRKTKVTDHACFYPTSPNTRARLEFAHKLDELEGNKLRQITRLDKLPKHRITL